MAKADINLFKAAGGERAKSAKRSPVSIMIVVGIVVVVIALGVAAYFNFRVNSANNNYKKNEKILANYNNTMEDPTIMELSEQYKTVMDDIESTSAINTYVETRSALYPEATRMEIKGIRDTIRNNPLGVTFTLTTSAEEDKEDRVAAGIEESEEEEAEEEDEEIQPIDYDALRDYLYDDEVEPFSDRELFNYALKSLAKKQENSDGNVWYAYYRCYFVAVFTGGDNFGMSQLVKALSTDGGTMGGKTPFSKLAMQNDYYDDGYYYPAKYKTLYYEDVYYQVLLLPMKSVIERAYDILSARSTALIEENHWEGQPENASFEVKELVISNSEMMFLLRLPKTASMTDYMHAFDSSYFFSVDYSVTRPDGDMVNEEIVAYPIKLIYKNRPVFEAVEED